MTEVLDVVGVPRNESEAQDIATALAHALVTVIATQDELDDPDVLDAFAKRLASDLCKQIVRLRQEWRALEGGPRPS